ncbi:predicted protein [Phaeodactylum tricornutum CCAP 1055/1]|uniref:Tyrosine-protein kinase ephrin type A/B receptor-like domain-containing protein n=1 Tax=Phaeodactylum tricornutum (strain CCAP 1055/1) TaxID=556484 RepID=B7FYY6_PHATC|nr:predicted protein [Phaeodactylum tricornutum CCAP 1055/1]EEC48440.1 predicted protein [Phaeodactylum tricornutum CCAP 1055/1]|eukprot:XP_002180249.1 predicted protein [Phaeodactylum tricornutum CCAP 1055/1]
MMKTVGFSNLLVAALCSTSGSMADAQENSTLVCGLATSPCPAGCWYGVILDAPEEPRSCLPVEKGHFSGAEDDVRYACSAGTYSSSQVAEECTLCPAGAFSNGFGSTSCTSCPSGSYAILQGADTCAPCSTDRYDGEGARLAIGPNAEGGYTCLHPDWALSIFPQVFATIAPSSDIRSSAPSFPSELASFLSSERPSTAPAFVSKAETVNPSEIPSLSPVFVPESDMLEPEISEGFSNTVEATSDEVPLGSPTETSPTSGVTDRRRVFLPTLLTVLVVTGAVGMLTYHRSSHDGEYEDDEDLDDGDDDGANEVFSACSDMAQTDSLQDIDINTSGPSQSNSTVEFGSDE